MICRLYERQLSAYLDGELAVTRARRLEAHLRVCPHCRGELNAIIGIADHVRAASRGVQVSRDFDQRVLRAVGYYQVTGRPVVRQRSLVRPVVAAAVALAALGGLIWHFLALPPVSQPQPQPAAAMVAPAPASPAGPALPNRRHR